MKKKYPKNLKYKLPYKNIIKKDFLKLYKHFKILGFTVIKNQEFNENGYSINETNNFFVILWFPKSNNFVCSIEKGHWNWKKIIVEGNTIVDIYEQINLILKKNSEKYSLFTKMIKNLSNL